MEHEIHASHCLQDTIVAPHIAQIETDRAILQPVAHIVLLLLVPAEDANLSKSCLPPHIHDGIAKSTCTARNEKCLVHERFSSLLCCHASSSLNQFSPPQQIGRANGT